MTTSKLLFLAMAGLLGACAAPVDGASIPPAPKAGPGPGVVLDTGVPSGEGVGSAAPEARVFVAGGEDVAGKPTADVFSAPVLVDGTLGAWRAEASLPAPSAGVSIARAGAELLVVGGPDVLASIAGGDGVVHWRAVSSGAALSSAAVTTDGRSLLVLGGERGGRPTPFGLVAPLANDGVPGAFTSTVDLPSSRSHFGAARLGGTVFAVGGSSESIPTDEVLAGRVAADGSVAQWDTAPSLPHALSDHAVVAAGDNLLVLGGLSTLSERAVFTAAVDDAGKLLGWTDAGAMPTAVHGHCVVASGANLFVFGGSTDDARATVDVVTTTVNMDGTLSPWRKLAPLPAARAHAGCAVR
jgi:hypothetical protein